MIYKLWNRIYFISALAFWSFLLFLSGTNPVKATTTDLITQTEYSASTGGASVEIQSFIMPTSNWISGVSLYNRSVTGSVYVRLCKGSGIASGTPLTAKNCDYGSSELVATTTCSLSLTNNWNNCSFSYSYYGTEGSLWYFVIERVSGNDPNVYSKNTKVYADGDCVAWNTGYSNFQWCGGYAVSTYSKTFKVYSDDSLAQKEDSTIYDNEITLESNSDQIFDYAYEQTCIQGSPCYLQYTYNKSIVGNVISLTNGNNATIIYATSTLVDNLNHNSYFLIDESYGSTTQTFKLMTYLFIGSVYTQVYGHNHTVKWVTSSEWETMAGWPSVDAICADVATSSDFYFAIDCGFRKIIYWIIYPDDTQQQKLQANIQKATQQFPISVGYQIYDLVASAASSTATTTLSVPLKWWNNSTKSYETVGTLLSTSTLAVGMGSNLYNTYYDLAEKFIYLMVFLYMFVRILGMINHNFNGNMFGSRKISNTTSEPKRLKTKEELTIDLRNK